MQNNWLLYRLASCMIVNLFLWLVIRERKPTYCYGEHSIWNAAKTVCGLFLFIFFIRKENHYDDYKRSKGKLHLGIQHIHPWQETVTCWERNAAPAHISFRLGDGYFLECLEYMVHNKNMEMSQVKVDSYEDVQREYQTFALWYYHRLPFQGYCIITN